MIKKYTSIKYDRNEAKKLSQSAPRQRRPRVLRKKKNADKQMGAGLITDRSVEPLNIQTIATPSQKLR